MHQGLAYRPGLFRVSTAMVVVLALLSYPIADIARGQGLLPQQYLGTLTIVQFTALSACMLLAWSSLAAKPDLSIADYRWLMVCAIVARLLLIPVDTYTSSDIDRYLFDGKIALEGLDPYRVNHEAPELQALRQEWQPPPEHAAYPTIYPPIALLLFSVAASVGVTLATLAWKVLVALASIGTVLLGAQLLQRARLQRHLPLLALSPILVLETGIGAHIDSFSTLLVCAALVAWQAGRDIRCGLLIGIGALIKILPLALLLPLFWGANTPRQAITRVTSAALCVAAGYLVALALGFVPVGSLPVFFERWRFGAPLFSGLSTLLSTDTLWVALLSIGVITGLIISYQAWCARALASAQRQRRLGVLMQVSMALPLCLSPVAFPWYLAPLMPLLALAPNATLLIWSSLVPLTYEVLNQFACCQHWQPANWPLVAIAVGTVLAMTWDTTQRTRNQARDSA